MEELVAYLSDKVAAVPAGQRFLLGIVGYPGAGKSTLAQGLVEAFNRRHPGTAAVVPMDGFHLPNKVLDELQLRPLKGIPETFDASGFVSLLRALADKPAGRVECPAFDRSVDEPIAGAIVIEPAHKLLVVEGNYLLLKTSPWTEVADILNETWFIDVDIETIVPRLIERHIKGGRTEEAARQKMECTDLRNARLIATTREHADRIISN